MGRIVTSVRITNVREASKPLRCDALVDTGASYMILPKREPAAGDKLPPYK